MTDVLQIVDSTLAVADQVVQTVEVGYIAQTVAQGGGAVTSVNGHSGAVVLGASDVGAVASSLVTAKGDLLVATGSGAIARHGIGTDGQVLTANSGQSDGAQWATPTRPYYPLSGYGISGATFDPMLAMGVGTPSANQIWLARAFVPAGVPINTLWFGVRTAGTYATSAVPTQGGVFDDNGNEVQLTANDTTLFTSTGWRRADLLAPVAAQNTDRYVYLGALPGGTSGISWPVPTGASDSLVALQGGSPVNSRRRCMFIATATGFPGSFDPTSYGTASNFVPLIEFT